LRPRRTQSLQDHVGQTPNALASRLCLAAANEAVTYCGREDCLEHEVRAVGSAFQISAEAFFAPGCADDKPTHAKL
jgi:hypothetical protein